MPPPSQSALYIDENNEELKKERQMTEIDIQSPPGRREMPEKKHIRMERMTAGSMPTIQKNIRNDVFNMPSPTN